MNHEDFESWFVPTPRRLHALDRPPHNLRLLSAILAGIAALCGVAYLVLK